MRARTFTTAAILAASAAFLLLSSSTTTAQSDPQVASFASHPYTTFPLFHHLHINLTF